MRARDQLPASRVCDLRYNDVRRIRLRPRSRLRAFWLAVRKGDRRTNARSPGATSVAHERRASI